MAVITGTNNPDAVSMTSGVDTISTLDDNDTIYAKGYLTATDKIDGGAGYDHLVLEGDYSSLLTFGAMTIQNIEFLDLVGGHDYNLKTNNGNLAAGQLLTITLNGGADSHLIFNGSGETDGRFTIHGGGGDDQLTGGGQTDAFFIEAGGNDTIHGGGGDDIVEAGLGLTADDRLDGGTGYDTLSFGVSLPLGLVLGNQTVTNFEQFGLRADADQLYAITTDDSTVAAGQVLKIAPYYGFSMTLAFDGSNETNGSFDIYGGYGNDTLIGGAKGDTFDISRGGNDTISGGGGDDTVTAQLGIDGNDFIDGGAGFDGLVESYIQGGSQVLSGTNVKSVEWFGFLDSSQSTRTVTTTDSLVAAGQKMSVYSYLTGSSNYHWDGSAETDGQFGFIDSYGDDVLIGGAKNDDFDLRNGGADTLVGNDGADLFRMYGGLTPADQIDGGTGIDTISLDGDYSAGVMLDAGAVKNIESFTLTAGHSYNLTFTNNVIAAGQALDISAWTLNLGDSLIVDDSLETDGSISVNAGQTLRSAISEIHGGSGTKDVVTLSGDYSGGVTFGALTMTGIETLGLSSGSSYKLTTNDGNVAAGATLNVSDYYNDAAHSLIFDGSAETDGQFSIMAGLGNDSLTGGAKNDRFDLGQGGSDTVLAGDGDDIIDVGSSLSAGDHIDGGAGQDRLLMDGGASATISGAMVSNVETFELFYGADYALTLKDDVLATGQSLTVKAQYLAADDILTFNAALEKDAAITVLAGSADDMVTTGGGNDTLNGGAGADTLNGGAGNDILIGGAGADHLTGGSGIDTASYASSQAVNVSLTGAVGGGDAEGDVLVGIENLTGSQYGDTLTGNVLANVLDGGNGDDVLHGGAGADVLTGGNGYDTVDYTGSQAVTINLLTQTASGGDAEGDILSGIENVTGSAYDDVITGSLANNVLSGMGGQDTLTGSAGSDTLDGGSGNDTLDGGAANDVLIGGTGDDVLVGGNGWDTLSGGAGQDTFKYLTYSDSKAGALHDVILDFDSSDLIDLAGIDANLALAGDQAFTFIGEADFTGLGQLRWYHSGNDVVIQGNIAGDGAPEFELFLSGYNAQMNAADFFL